MIHSFLGSQDVRLLSKAVNYIPFTSSCLLICSLSLRGFPFLAAFYSKDKIVEEALSAGGNGLILSLLFISILFTSIYRFRLISFISFKNYSFSRCSIFDRRCLTKSIGCLTVGGVLGGRILI